MERPRSERLRLFHCVCGDAALSVYRDPEDEEYPYIRLSFWKWGHGGSAGSIRDRLEHVWYILRYGHPYEDEVMLDKEQAFDLAAHLRCLAEAVKETSKV